MWIFIAALCGFLIGWCVPRPLYVKLVVRSIQRHAIADEKGAAAWIVGTRKIVD